MEKRNMVSPLAMTILVFISFADIAHGQSSKLMQRILVDVSHGQRFWNDPALMGGKDPALVERINYMNGELVKNATAVKEEVSYLKGKITPNALKEGNVLFIHIPSAKYDSDEVKAIQLFLQKGGSLFLVMDADYWSTLEQVNANDILSPYNIKFGKDSPATGTGAHTKAGLVTQKDLSIPYHGARLVEGGTPFAFNNQTNETFGTYAELKNGGKIIAMGDGMVSLYMTSWEGVNNYQCSEFMHDALAWLAKK
jgi:hypothetical protein